jgi:hypothetical protein
VRYVQNLLSKKGPHLRRKGYGQVIPTREGHESRYNTVEASHLIQGRKTKQELTGTEFQPNDVGEPQPRKEGSGGRQQINTTSEPL